MKHLLDKLKNAFLALMMVVVSLPLSSLTAGALATDQPSVKNQACRSYENSNIELCKTAQEVPGMVNTWDITLKIKSKKVTTTSDTVLVIDRSGSMNSNGRMPAAKTAARSFVNTLLPAGNTTNRIALVSFAGEVQTNSNFTNNAATLISAINGLNANGGTYTQAAIHEAQEILATSTADYKTIVLLSDGEPTYSVKMYNPDSYLSSQYISTASPSHDVYGFRQATTAGAPASQYNYDNRVGEGYAMFHRYYNPLGTSGDQYYNHGNSTIAEAGFAKNAGGSTIYTVALEAGAQGNNVLSAVASLGNAYTAKPADLQQIFSKIAGEISNFIKDAGVVDQMGDGIIASSVDNSYAALAGSAEILNAGKTITWTPTFTQEGDFFVAEKTYRIQLDGTKLVDGLYDANQIATLTYNSGQTANFPVPKVDPTFVKIEKKLEGDDCTNCEFTFELTLPNGGKESHAVKLGEVKTLYHPMPVGNYSIVETSAEDASGNDLPLVQYNTSVVLDKFALTQAGADVAVTATNTLKKININVKKVWEGKIGDKAVIRLTANGVEKDHVELTGEPWSHTFVNLPKHDRYTGNEITYNVIEDDIKDENGEIIYTSVVTSSTAGFTVTNTYKSPKISITAHKKWVNGPIARPKVQLRLLREGNSTFERTCILEAQEVASGGAASCTWDNLDKNNNMGEEYVYYIREAVEGLPGFYIPSYDPETKLTVVNTYQIPTGGTAAAKKIWLNGPSNNRPTVWFKLYRQIEGGAVEAVDGAEIKALTHGTETVTWDNLKTTDINGNTYIFSVKEVDADGNDFTPENYTKIEQGLKVTNKYVIPTDGTATANKVWVGGSALGERPTVYFKLYRHTAMNSTPVAVPSAQPEMLTDGDLIANWSNLETTDINGNAYIFTVKEVDASGDLLEWSESFPYIVSQQGMTITNTYQSRLISLTGTKQWVNGNNLVRPSIELELYRCTEVSPTRTLVQGSRVSLSPLIPVSHVWTNTWDNLEATDDQGNLYTYEVREVSDILGYETTYDDAKWTVINTYQIPETDVTAAKAWVNGPETKPTVWFQLWRQIGEAEASIVPDAEIKELATGLESVTWTNIDKTDIDGNEYIFSVKEVDASGNDFTPTNYSKREAGLNVTNTYVVPTADIVVIKKWVDQFTNHPEIEVDLLRDGEMFLESTAILNAENDWMHVWEDVALTDENGVAYEFEVVEITQIKQYESAITGSLEDGFLIVNTWQEPGKGGAPIVTPPNTGRGSSITSLMVLGSCLTLIGVFGIKRYNY